MYFVLNEEESNVDQLQLRKLNGKICENPQKLFDALDLDFNIENNKVITSCVLHNGDNSHALNIDLEKGRWICWTHGCQDTFRSSLIGFTRGVLSNQRLNWRSQYDGKVSFGSTLEFLQNLYNFSDSGPTNEVDREKDNFINQLAAHRKEEKVILTREEYLAGIRQSDYFLQRGFTEKVLRIFDVGSCKRGNRFFGGRSLVPTFDVDGRKVLGISGRSESSLKPKWLHSEGFPSGNSLYGLWLAKELVRSSHSVALVEGPCDVWRLWEAGIYNACGLNGGYLTAAKHVLLDRLGVMNIRLILDNDKAGNGFVEKIKSQWGKFYNITVTGLPNGIKDLGAMSSEKIQDILC